MTLPIANAASSPKVDLNGETVIFPDTQPYINDDNRTMVPVRFVSEKLKAVVIWDPDKYQVTVLTGDSIISMLVGDRNILVDGKIVQLDTEVIIKDGRTMVPLRFISEALKCQVEWNEKIQTVYIKNKAIPDNSNPVPVPVPVTKTIKFSEVGTAPLIIQGIGENYYVNMQISDLNNAAEKLGVTKLQLLNGQVRLSVMDSGQVHEFKLVDVFEDASLYVLEATWTSSTLSSEKDAAELMISVD